MTTSLLFHHDALLDSGIAHDGVRELLAALRAAGYRVGVVTAEGAAEWRAAAGRAGLEEPDVVAGDGPSGLREAAAALEEDAAAVAFVAGSPESLRAAREAGMRVGAALWAGGGEVGREALRAERPDWLFERPSDVTRRFAAWC
jgi:phosphoglycolate phosphatase-like HAD superfamily hydrolase